MNAYFPVKLRNAVLFLTIGLSTLTISPSGSLLLAQGLPVHHYLYVATPGVRNYLEYGGHGLLVFDMDNNFKFIKRITTGGLDDKGEPSNVKGIVVSVYTHCIYISTIKTLQCLDLLTEKPVWEK